MFTWYLFALAGILIAAIGFFFASKLPPKDRREN